MNKPVQKNMSNKIIKSMAFLAAGLGLFNCKSIEKEEAQPPNIILFFADDLGYGDIGCFGNPNIRTPNIDRLANDGIKLTSFYVTAAQCTASRAGLMTGRYPIHTLPGNIAPWSQDGLPLDEPVITELLKEAGYRTMAVGKWHLGHARNEFLPTGRGFDRFYGLLYSNDMIKPWVNTDLPLELYVDEKPVKTVNYDQESLTVDCTVKAVNFIKETSSQPFFIYVPYIMPHLPISTTSNFLGQSEGGFYGDVIETIDWSVGEIIEALKLMGVDDNTLIIFTSDNGPWHNLPERMLQKGVKPWHQGTAGLLHGAKASTYEGGMRVPAVFNWKGHIPGGQISSEIVSTLDIFPTLVEVAGAILPEGKELDGFNILPFLQGKSASPRKDFYYFRGTILEAVREGQWKLRYSNHSKPGTSPDDPVEPELFNMKDDPGENYNKIEIYPETGNYLIEKMRFKANKVNADL